MRTLVLLGILVLSAILLAHAAPAAPATPPVPGPGAVIQMHRQLFRAIDSGDKAAALEFLHADMHMDEEYLKRPCQLWISDAEGQPLSAQNHAESSELMAQWIDRERAGGGSYETTISSRAADCFSAELSYAVLDIERKHSQAGETTTKRWRSSSLVTYAEGGWKLTHMHISPAE